MRKDFGDYVGVMLKDNSMMSQTEINTMKRREKLKYLEWEELSYPQMLKAQTGKRFLRAICKKQEELF